MHCLGLVRSPWPSNEVICERHFARPAGAGRDLVAVVTSAFPLGRNCGSCAEAKSRSKQWGSG